MSNLTHSDGNNGGTGNMTLLENPELCTLQTCDLSLANFLYLPSIPANAIFTALFGILILGQLFLGIKHKTWGYMVAMVLGLVLEVIGYIARILIHYSPFDNDDFLMYLVCLTIAPALLTASIYLCLARIIVVYGEHLSIFRPRTYTIVFCTCDFICLVLQATGGGIASASNTDSDQDLGKNLMLAGLIFQVFSLALFVCCASEFALRVWKGKGTWNPKYHHIASSTLFKSFLVGLAVATITIFVRCVYRCAELQGGFHSELFTSDEDLFIVLEGVMVSIACVCLTFLHPGVCFQGVWDEVNFKFRKVERSGSSKMIFSDEETGGESVVELGDMGEVGRN